MQLTKTTLRRCIQPSVCLSACVHFTTWDSKNVLQRKYILGLKQFLELLQLSIVSYTRKRNIKRKPACVLCVALTATRQLLQLLVLTLTINILSTPCRKAVDIYILPNILSLKSLRFSLRGRATMILQILLENRWTYLKDELWWAFWHTC